MANNENEFSKFLKTNWWWIAICVVLIITGIWYYRTKTSTVPRKSLSEHFLTATVISTKKPFFLVDTNGDLKTDKEYTSDTLPKVKTRIILTFQGDSLVRWYYDPFDSDVQGTTTTTKPETPGKVSNDQKPPGKPKSSGNPPKKDKNKSPCPDVKQKTRKKDNFIPPKIS